jgi:hypothetical protein
MLTSLVLVPTPAHAGKNKFDVAVGTFSAKSKTSNGGGTVSGLGLYQFSLRRAVAPQFELSAGFTIYFTQLIKGDSGSGLDLAVYYYPITTAGQSESSAEGASFSLQETWRPYLAASFNQRNFQSVQTSYTGFGALAGIERTINSMMSATATGRMLFLNAPRGASATETTFYGGLSFFW